MKTVLIAGATGMVGGHALQLALDHPDIQQVRTLGRKAVDQSHPKLKQWTAEDLSSFEDANCFSKVDTLLFCVGAYTGALKEAAFRHVNVDIPYAVAKQLQVHAPQANFCLLSGQGADRTEKSRVQFAREKGIIENKLSALGLGGFATFRPGYIYPVNKREEPNWMYALSRHIYPLLKRNKNMSIPSDALAHAMLTVGLKPVEQEVWENAHMRALTS